MNNTPPEWLEIDENSRVPPILIVGRITTGKDGKGVELRRAKTTVELRDRLFDIVSSFLEVRSNDEFIPYSETRLLESAQTFTGYLNEAIGRDEEHEANAIDKESIILNRLSLIRSDEDDILLQEIKKTNFTFYIILARNSDGEDVAYVRKLRGFHLANNPSRRGHFLINMVQNDYLDVLNSPIFKLDEKFDFAIKLDLANNQSEVAIWNVNSFLEVFIDTAALQSAVPRYLNHIEDALPSPSLSNKSKIAILDAARKSVRTAKQVRRLSRVDYLERVTLERLNSYLEKVKEVSKGISTTNTGIELERDAVDIFLNLLEQRYWRGHFNDSIYESQAHIENRKLADS
ncbi:DUF4868 domain-containing protein [Dermabacteraceae bacterium TAE3-ERU27]|nr:DUF4868 domain-containing protein [Dermabacteraceae bacterium TAE3-ERU27]